MAFSVQNNIAIMNGNNGIYDNKIQNPSVKYGRNAASNNFEYLKKLKGSMSTMPPQMQSTTGGNLLKSHITELKTDQLVKYNNEFLASLPQLDFEYQYMPEGKLDKMALLGAAFEEMGKKLTMGVEELTQKLKPAIPTASAKALDINNDNQIDVTEYAASILSADMLSKNPNMLDAKNITGKINKQGLYNNIAYVMPQNEAIAKEEFRKIYQTFDLNSAGREFQSSPSNYLDIQA